MKESHNMNATNARKPIAAHPLVASADAIADIVDVAVARAEFNALGDALASNFLERRAVIDGLLAALVAGEHVLLLGEPGTAKSDLARALCSALEGRFFATLCTRHQQPDEVVGHWDLRALQDENRYVRRVARRLPEAHIAFLDEVFKGSSALLNTLLTIINERTFENDGQAQSVPLRMVVAASNEVPEEQDNLGAFYDRFLLRFDVKCLKSEKSVRAVLFGEGPAPLPLPRLSMAVVDVLQEAAAAVEITEDAKASIIAIRQATALAEIKVSDRRWKKAVRLLRAKCALDGVERMTSEHVGLLEDCVWDHIDQRPKVQEIIRNNVASWVRDIMKADSTIDELTARATASSSAGGKKSDSITALGKCMDIAVETAKTVQAIGKKHKEAAVNVARVNKRIAELEVLINAGMRANGIGGGLLGTGGAL